MLSCIIFDLVPVDQEWQRNLTCRSACRPSMNSDDPHTEAIRDSNAAVTATRLS